MKILIAEGDAVSRRVLEVTLARFGHETLSMCDGEAAWSALGAPEAPALAVLDWMMPGMDGLELARAVAATRLVMLTSLGHRADSETLRRAGITCCLTKPVRQVQLHEALTSAVVNAEGGRGRLGPEKPPGAAGDGGHAAADAKGRNMRVLLAEDNPVNQKVALRQLEKLGYSADAVANGREALEALASIPYDLVPSQSCTQTSRRYLPIRSGMLYIQPARGGEFLEGRSAHLTS